MLSNQQIGKIVHGISQTLSRDVIFIDGHGMIAASTVKEFVGQFHVVGKSMIDDGPEELYLDSNESEAVQKGLYIALNQNDRTVGVIGIIGEKREIEVSAKLIQKMFTFFLDELSNTAERREYRDRLQRFLELCVLEDWTHLTNNQIELGQSIGIDVQTPKRVMVVSPDRAMEQNMKGSSESDTGNTVRRYLRQVIKANIPGCLCLSYADKEILVMGEPSDARAVKAAENLKYFADRSYNLQLKIGISEPVNNLHAAYLQAEKAWKITEMEPSRIVFYGNMAIARFVTELPADVKIDYVRRVFLNCSYTEICAWMEVVSVYFKTEGSLNKGAEMLYVHKNTYQYKLNRLRDITGCDIRLPSDAAIFYMAMVFFMEVGPKMLMDES